MKNWLTFFCNIASPILVVTLLAGCSAARTTGKIVKGVGKVGWGTAKITSKVAWKTAKVTTKATGKGLRTAAYLARGKQIIPLERVGSGLYAKVRVNRKVDGKFLVDTGASKVLISRSMAERLRLDLSQGTPIVVTTAGGHLTSGKVVSLKELRVAGARLVNVEAIVMDQDALDMQDGLLGMSFLNHFVFSVDTKKPELILKQRFD